MYQTCQVLPQLPGSSLEQSLLHPSKCVNASAKPTTNCTRMTPDFRCESLNQKNLYTGNFNCPTANYVAVNIIGAIDAFPIRPEVHQRKVCKDPHDQRTCHNENYTVYYKDQVALHSFYCVKNPNITTPLSWRSGTLFGGTYRRGQVNPLTKAESCPGSFQKHLLASDAYVCLSTNYDADKPFSAPFSKFFSCQWSIASRKCPAGFVQYLATVANSCEIFYCMQQ